MSDKKKGLGGVTVQRARVLYADTDKMGVVYHATYLRWFEAGRARYMRLRGLAYDTIEKTGVQLPVVEAHATYHKPARYDDVISVATWLEDMGRLQLVFNYEISLNGEVLVRGYTRHASINLDGKLVRLPAEVQEALTSEEKITGEDEL